ncbi:Transposon Ty1-DR2 Gag polyprotein, partial [Bienertia sinuspersici]
MVDSSKIHPATLVTNIKQHIPIVLDYSGAEYNNWSTLFKLHCRAYLTLADSLKNVGDKVSDNRMALQLLKGLSDDYKAFRTSVRHIKPLPSFDELRSMLELEEQSNASDLADEARDTALSAATTPPSPPSAAPPARGNSSRGGGRKSTKGKGKNRGGPNAAQKAAPPRHEPTDPASPPANAGPSPVPSSLPARSAGSPASIGPSNPASRSASSQPAGSPAHADLDTSGPSSTHGPNSFSSSPNSPQTPLSSSPMSVGLDFA